MAASRVLLLGVVTRPGAAYVIQREFHQMAGQFLGTMEDTAREQDASGVVTALVPVKSDADIRACKMWEATLARGGAG